MALAVVVGVAAEAVDLLVVAGRLFAFDSVMDPCNQFFRKEGKSQWKNSTNWLINPHNSRIRLREVAIFQTQILI